MFRSKGKSRKRVNSSIFDLRANALFAAMLLALGGCSMGAPRAPSDKEASSESSATFQVMSVEDGGTAPKSVNQNWLITTEQRFKFKVCLQSVINGNAVAAHDFNITDDHGVAISGATTDPNGCLKWFEDVPFEPLASAPTYLTFIRRLTADGRQRGTVTVEIGVNPWHGVIGDEAAVVDLSPARGTRVHKIADAEMSRKILAGKASAGPAAQLLIQSIEHEFVRAKAGTGLTPMLQLSFRPQIVVQTMSGSPQYLSVKAGAILVKPRLLRTDAGPNAATAKKQQLHDDLEAKREIVKDEKFLVEIPLSLNAVPNASGLYEISLTAVPDAAPLGLGISDRVYMVGDHAKLAKGTAQLTNESKRDDFSTKELNIEVVKKSAAPLSNILADPLSPSFAGIRYNGMKREIRVNFSTNLRDAISLQTIEPGREIEISALTSGNRPIPTETLANGVINWEDTLTHNAYEKHKRKAYTIRIMDTTTGSSTDRVVYFNLADPHGPTFAFDKARVGSRISGTAADETEVANSRFAPKFKLETVCIGRKAINYQIDTDLNLLIWNRYQIRLQGEVLRPDSLSHGTHAPPEPLLSGRYLVSLLIYRSGDIQGAKSTPLVAAQKIVEYEGGQFTTDIIVPVNHLSLALLKNYLVVQIAPLRDELQMSPRSIDDIALDTPEKLLATDLGVQFPAHATAFTPPTKDECVTIATRDNVLDRRILELYSALPGITGHRHAHEMKLVTAPVKTAEEEAQSWRKSAQRLKLQEILASRDSDLGPLGISASLHDFAKALHCWDQHSWADEADQAKCIAESVNQKIGAELCGLLKIKVLSELEDCRKNARDLLRVEERTFVYRLAGSKYTDGLAASFSISNSYGMGKARFTDYGNMIIDAATVAVGVGVSGGVGKQKGPVNAGASLTGDLTAAKNWWSVESNSHREINDNFYGFSASVPMSLERLNFDLELARHRTCYAVGAKGLKHNKNEKRVKAFQGAFICFQPSSEPRKVRESYYHLFTPETSTVTIDQTVERNRIMIPIRGERDYYFFMRNLYLASSPFYRNGVPIEITELLKRGVEKVVQKLPIEASVVGSRAVGRENYDAIQEKIKKMDPFWNPGHDFKNIPIRNINDPELRMDAITQQE